MRWLFLLLLLLVPLVSAYEVNSPLDIKVKLQFDNGTALIDIVSQSCIASVYSAADEDLVVRDSNMTAGAYHNVTFTPTTVGEHTVSIKCVYGNETVTYHEDFSITQPIVGGGGGRVLNLNVKILPDQKRYSVNVRKESSLSFPVQYSVGGKLQNSNEASWRLVREDMVLAKGGFRIIDTGTYEFTYDFKDMIDGAYKLFLDFDGRTEIVDVVVVSKGAGESLLSGMVVASDGSFSIVRAGISLLFLLLLLMLLVLFFRRRRRGK